MEDVIATPAVQVTLGGIVLAQLSLIAWLIKQLLNLQAKTIRALESIEDHLGTLDMEDRR